MISPSLKSFKNKFFAEVTEIPPLFQSSYIPSLNGFRALSIMFVIFGHTVSRSTNPFIVKVETLATLGVYVFFVISGFLITTLLLKEKIKTGGISLKGFYKRRLLRILPLAYLYVFVVFILNKLFHLNIPSFAFVGPVLFLVNEPFFNRSQYLGHYWSLSVEEQFYLLFPALLKSNFKRYLVFLLTLLVVIIAFRYINFYQFKNHFKPLYLLQHVKELINKLDGIIIGSLLAILAFKNMLPLQFLKEKKWLVNLVLIPVVIALHCGFVNVLDGNIKSVVISVLISFLLISNIQKTDSFSFKLLNNSVLNYIGVMSYSLYIWQQLFTFTVKPLFANGFPFGETIWFNLIVLIVVALASYNLYEKQFLKLKAKI